METNCERDLMSLVKIIKNVFNIECNYEYYPPKNFHTSFHYKCYEIQVYTSVDIYRENYENDGHVAIEIKDERINKRENINRLSLDPTFFGYLLKLYEDMSYNGKYNEELYKEYLYKLKEYLDNDKIYFLLSDINNEKYYILYKNELKELKCFISFGDYYLRYTNLFGGKIARRIINYEHLYDEDCLYDIEKLRNGHTNTRIKEDFDYLKNCITEIFGNIEIDDSTSNRESIYNTLHFEYKDYCVEISSYFDERHGKTYDDSKYQITFELLDKDNSYNEELIMGTSFIDMLAIYNKESFNMKFHKELYKKYLCKVKKYIDENKVCIFILNEKEWKKYRLCSGEKVEIKGCQIYTGDYENNINLYGKRNAKRIEKYKPIYE